MLSGFRKVKEEPPAEVAVVETQGAGEGAGEAPAGSGGVSGDEAMGDGAHGDDSGDESDGLPPPSESAASHTPAALPAQHPKETPKKVDRRKIVQDFEARSAQIKEKASREEVEVDDLEDEMKKFYKSSQAQQFLKARQANKKEEKLSAASVEALMWDNMSKDGFVFPARGHALSGRFDRAKAKDKDLKENYDRLTCGEQKAKMRQEWAEGLYKKYTESKVCTH